ncbi:MAG: hypothetical protein KDG55_18575 [Rhodocyclaceae bacterium]|nr:hypothetical protein [Rhodocyclaceae bacterium]
MKQQRGFILPLLMAILLIGGLLYHFDAKRLASDLARVRLERTRAALAEAREALIAHAATYHLMPDHSATNPRLGLLPCPDTDGSGSATLTDCKSMNDAVLGRLPYRTLALPRLVDGDGECLWYAVAGRIKNNPLPNEALNWDTPGQFAVTPFGASLPGGPSSRAIAVLAAPGRPLASQDRSAGGQTCGASSDASIDRPRFLEGTPAMGDPTLQTIQAGDPSSPANNDLVAWVTIDDIFDRAARMSTFGAYLGTISDAIAAAHPTLSKVATEAPGPVEVESLPTGDTSFVGPVGTLDADDMARRYLDWQAMYRYVRCVPDAAGNVPQCLDLNGTLCQAILAFGGRRAPNQDRSSTSLAAYFEGTTLAALSTGSTHFEGPTTWNPDAPTADVLRCLN